MDRKAKDMSDVEVVGTLAIVPVYIVLAVVAVCVRSLVFQSLWGWFLTPVIWLPAPGLAVCIGLTLVAGYVLRPGATRLSQEKHGAWASLGLSLLEGAVVWGLGWLVHLFA